VLLEESFAPLLRELGLEPRHFVLEELITEVCGERPEHLSFQDVANIMELLREREGFLVAELERFRKVFRDFDSDDSGDMSAGELISAMGWLGYPASADLLNDLYAQSDINGNGVLSFSEFVICMRHMQDRELISIRSFLQRKKEGKISTLKDLEALLHNLGYVTTAAAITDSLQEAGLCSKADMAMLRLAGCGMHMDVDDVCSLLQCMRSRQGFTDAQMDELREVFQHSEPKDEDRIATRGGLHKVLRWLGHCHTFERLQQLIYEVDPDGSQLLDFTTFVKLVRKSRDFEHRAAVAAFHAADSRKIGLLDDRAFGCAMRQLGFECGKIDQHAAGKDSGVDLPNFLLSVMRQQKERLRCVRSYCNFTPSELQRLRSEFFRVDKEGTGEVKRHELPRLVEALFPAYAHSQEFRPILVRLLKQVRVSDAHAVKFSDFLGLIQTIREETDEHQCRVYSETIRGLDFSLREAAEFLSVFLSVSEEGTRKLCGEDLVTLFQQSFKMSDSECHQLHDCFSEGISRSSSCRSCLAWSDESSGRAEVVAMDFLEFLQVMRHVIQAGVGCTLLKKMTTDA